MDPSSNTRLLGRNSSHKFAIEYLGTAVLIYVVLSTGNAVAVGAALVLLILMGMALGGVGHFNPAITIAMTAVHRTRHDEMMGIIVLQILGALTGLEVFKRTH